MLTNENLSTVEGLTAEQITAITQISEHQATSWKTEQSATLNQAANTNANKIIEGMVGSVFKSLEIEPTGKLEGEKDSAYLSRLITDSKINPLNTKLADLESQVQAGGTDEVLKSKYEALLQKESEWKTSNESVASTIQTLKEDHQKELEKAQSELSDFKLTAALNQSLPNFKKEITSNELSDAGLQGRIKLATHRIKTQYSIVWSDGKPIANKMDETGNVVLESKEIAALLAEAPELKDFIDVGHSQGGVGSSGANGGSDLALKGDMSHMDMANYATEQLKSEGVKPNSQDWYDKYPAKLARIQSEVKKLKTA